MRKGTASGRAIDKVFMHERDNRSKFLAGFIFWQKILAALIPLRS